MGPTGRVKPLRLLTSTRLNSGPEALPMSGPGYAASKQAAHYQHREEAALSAAGRGAFSECSLSISTRSHLHPAGPASAETLVGIVSQRCTHLFQAFDANLDVVLDHLLEAGPRVPPCLELDPDASPHPHHRSCTSRLVIPKAASCHITMEALSLLKASRLRLLQQGADDWRETWRKRPVRCLRRCALSTCPDMSLGAREPATSSMFFVPGREGSARNVGRDGGRRKVICLRVCRRVPITCSPHTQAPAPFPTRSSLKNWDRRKALHGIRDGRTEALSFEASPHRAHPLHRSPASD